MKGMFFPIRSGALALCALCVMLFGCGGPKHYPVRGTVTLDGKPLPDASIAFTPEGEQGAAAAATTDSQGNYRLQAAGSEGAQAGKYVVRISTFSEGNPDEEPPAPPIPERVPAKYNIKTTLLREVKAQENVIDFPLDSKGEIIEPPPPE